MQLSTSRPLRVRRLLAISAAAVAVSIGPTACDYGVAGGLHHSGSGSSSDGVSGTDQNSGQPVVVPVANTSNTPSGRHHHRGGHTTTTTATPEPVADTTTEEPTTEPSDTATDSATADPTTDPTAAPVTDQGVGAALPAGGKAGTPNNGLDILGRDCVTGTNKDLPLHDGFQDDPAGKAACVNTEMGAVAAKSQLPSLLITDAPRVVGMNQAFTLKVATRNLHRNRFLGAAKGGYYLESSFLDDQGLQEGHFHTACRILPTTDEAPDSSVDPQFFLATEDGGGAKPGVSDTVTIPVPAIGKPGILQCTSWAGDGSHRTPMMTLAKETPAIDSVRIFVTQRDQPVRYDAAAANADSGANIAAQQQQGGQQPDVKPAAPAAPNAATAPADATVTGGDNAAAPVVENSGAAPSSAPASSAEKAPAGN